MKKTLTSVNSILNVWKYNHPFLVKYNNPFNLSNLDLWFELSQPESTIIILWLSHIFISEMNKTCDSKV